MTRLFIFVRNIVVEETSEFEMRGSYSFDYSVYVRGRKRPIRGSVSGSYRDWTVAKWRAHLRRKGAYNLVLEQLSI